MRSSSLQFSLASLRAAIRRHRLLALASLALAAGSSAQAHGDLLERIAALHVKLETRPNDAALHLELADIYCQHEDWQLAIAEAAVVDRLEPGKHPTDLLRGEAFLGAKSPQPSRAAFDRYLAANAGNVRALTGRARACLALRDMKSCLADFAAVWRATPRPEPELVFEYSEALAAAGQVDASLRLLQEGIEKVGPVPGLVMRVLDRETAAGRFDLALLRIDALQKSAPRPEPWMAKRATLLEQAGRVPEARLAWQALIDHLAALPNLERGSHAMSRLSEQAYEALAKLSAPSFSTLQPTHP